MDRCEKDSKTRNNKYNLNNKQKNKKEIKNSISLII